MTAEEARQAAARIIEEMEKLFPGFDIITDISELEPATKNEAEILSEVHKILLEHGVGRIVRIVGDNLKATVGKIQFERASRLAGVTALQFISIKAAERYLDGE
jgi:hypothetical protein